MWVSNSIFSPLRGSPNTRGFKISPQILGPGGAKKPLSGKTPGGAWAGQQPLYKRAKAQQRGDNSAAQKGGGTHTHYNTWREDRPRTPHTHHI